MMRALRPLLLACALLAPLTASAEFEHEVKSAFLYQFLSYVDWPEGSFRDVSEPFVIGVLDADDVYADLQAIVYGRLAQGRTIEVRKLEDADDLTGLHMICVGEAGRLALSDLAPKTGVLVVGEGERALDHGATISLVRAGDHVRFQVALGTAERQGLKISSRMLAVAQLVKRGPR